MRVEMLIKLKLVQLSSDAVFQKGKRDSAFSLSYKPVVTSNDRSNNNRFISRSLWVEEGKPSGLRRAPSNETDGATEALAQHEQAIGEVPEKLLADAGFNNNRHAGTCTRYRDKINQPYR